MVGAGSGALENERFLAAWHVAMAVKSTVIAQEDTGTIAHI